MRKNNHIKFHFTLLVITLIAYSFTAVYATPNNEEGSPPISHKNPSNTISTDKPLDIFYQESLAKHGFAIRTTRTVIIPVTSMVFGDIQDMYLKKETTFVPGMPTDPKELGEYVAQLLAYTNMDLEYKRELKIYDYAVTMWNEELKGISLAGMYSISPPDATGWAESRFILRPQYRKRGLGEEVKKAIYHHIVKNLVGTTIKIIKYVTDFDNPEALFTRHPENPDRGVINQKAKAYLEVSHIAFKGLQGWVHEDNIASIKLNQKCGWVECGTQEKMDLNGVMKKHFLYRSPSL